MPSYSVGRPSLGGWCTCFGLHVVPHDVQSVPVEPHELAPAVRIVLLDEAGGRALRRALDVVGGIEIDEYPQRHRFKGNDGEEEVWF